MKLILISDPDELADELKTVTALFEAGLERFHLRKPKYSTNKIRKYLDHVPPQYRDRIVIHSHHELSVTYNLAGIHVTEQHRRKNFLRTWMMRKYLKIRRPNLEITAGFHTLGSLKAEHQGYSYVFLSPVFDSISKIGYRSTFHEDSLLNVIRKSDYKVYALGGVDEERIEKAKEIGFYGVALLGSIWKSEEPLEKFKRIQQLCNSNGIT
ncbi:MAG: thiamine phosphate synthase [Chitinophagaceae bacterium]|nr:thiamine phosphate synthase [Chitinophagaceae bacterium]